MKVFGEKLATAGIALVSVGAIAVAPTVQAPPRPVPAVQLAAATSPTVVQSSPTVLPPPAQQSNYLGALFRLELGRFIIPPSAGQPIPTPQIGHLPRPPTSTASSKTRITPSSRGCAGGSKWPPMRSAGFRM